MIDIKASLNQISLKSNYFFSLIFLFMAVLLTLSDNNPVSVIGANKSEDLLFYSRNFIEGTYGTPFSSRLLLPSLFMGYSSLSLGLSLHHFAICLEILMLLGCQWALFRFLRHYVPKTHAMVGVLPMNIILHYMLNHIVGMSLVELIDIFNLLVLLVMLIAAKERRFYLLLLALGIGMFNRETPLILLPALAYFMYQEQWRVGQIVLIFLLGVLAFVGVRWMIASTWLSFENNKIAYNIPFLDMSLTSIVIKSNVRFFLLAGPLLLLAFWKHRKLPLLIRLLVFTSVPFIVLHYIVGTILEARMWMPLIVLLLPAVVLNVRVFLSDGDAEGTL